MPSLRQPVGPLPASIYWRRRVVVLAALAAVLALVLWLTSDQGGGGDQHKTAKPLPTPAQAITPGAAPTGPAITGRPGGTGGGSGGAGSGGVSGSGGGDVSLTGGGTDGGSAPAPGGGTAPGGTAAPGTTGSPTGSGGAGGTSGGPAAPPVNTAEVMALPVCASSQVTLELSSAQNAYQPKDKPRLALTVRNAGTAGCRVDLGRVSSLITLTASNGERVWSSGDCPTDRQSTWVQIAAGSGLTETFTWDRSRSKPQCASPDATAAPTGNYLVVADLSGLSGGLVSARSSIRLES
ncbi:hypothetical protein OG689_23345 [Kitasatospora sp. NBC_00240]|uniref:hypothetical protein n=1 Tax=Kitasatospora sp. NBC_00240 TaxID=2903567 RepID=UPI002252720D|nr:hypothetical protein [Kitasatospora sp. NBC_00240]MCX5212181.1 hypothetical protein [Kitasatospora sp. NBC_00240]